MKNNRVLRAEKWIRVEISNFLRMKIKNPNLQKVTITDVNVTNDLSYATVFWTVYDLNITQTQIAKIKIDLEHIKSILRTQIAKVSTAYKVPELIFKFDNTDEKANKIENILNNISKN